MSNRDRMIERIEELELALETCGDLFYEIRCDFRDPRHECRRGMKVVKKALSPETEAPE